MATRYASSFCFVILLCSAAAEAIDGGFSVELIPRDSPKSPFYDPLETPFQRVRKAVRRSIARIEGLRLNAAGVPSADLTNSGGEYLVNITIGTPPVQIVAIADTGSDLIWTQCKPCSSCFDQEAPLFDPRKSRTYAVVSCNSAKCQVYDQTSCSSRGSACQYQASYGDQSYTNGNIATDIVGLGSTSGRPIKFPGTVFGCGYDNAGTFDTHTSGIVGLGGGDSSLVSQIGRSSGGKFSYCLVPFFSTRKSSSKLSFGANARVAGRGTVSTPLVSKDPKTFYYLTLEGISINGKRFDASGSPGLGSGEGNIIIDSGTTLTLLPPDLYDQIEPAVAAAIRLPKAQDPSGYFNLCYRSSGVFKAAPRITVHFTGADVRLNWYNTFVEIEEGVTCFSFVPSSLDLAIYGNLAQVNFLIGYDFAGGKLSFKAADCTYH
ncbi:hypothetical protein MLD38_019177 [Melastoma candidum]|uniref:Uncharacterized protein n=1 Tax=Melastoma candidum TaxID=119954 RepID=A0ACB9QXG5_9MYRT|nr:hypothetical protein MLD38_019177 [Melastoma candidum]